MKKIILLLIICSLISCDKAEKVDNEYASLMDQGIKINIIEGKGGKQTIRNHYFEFPSPQGWTWKAREGKFTKYHKVEGIYSLGELKGSAVLSIMDLKTTLYQKLKLHKSGFEEYLGEPQEVVSHTIEEITFADKRTGYLVIKEIAYHDEEATISTSIEVNCYSKNDNKFYWTLLYGIAYNTKTDKAVIDRALTDINNTIKEFVLLN